MEADWTFIYISQALSDIDIVKYSIPHFLEQNSSDIKLLIVTKSTNLIKCVKTWNMKIWDGISQIGNLCIKINKLNIAEGTIRGLSDSCTNLDKIPLQIPDQASTSKWNQKNKHQHSAS